MADRKTIGRARWDRAIAALAVAWLAIYSYGPWHLRPESPDWVISWPRGLAVLAIVVVLRHLAHPRPALPMVMAAALRAIRPDGSRAVVRIGLASRLAVLIVGLAAALALGPLPSTTPTVSANPFWNLPARWDAFWYLSIARSGYEWQTDPAVDQWSVAFFPAHPVLMRVAGDVVTMPAYWFDAPWILGGSGETRTIFGGWLVSVLAFLWALGVVFRLARDDVGPERAEWALMLLAFFPFAVFYSVPYTESLFLLAVASAFLAARGDRWQAVFLWGALAALTRQTGVLLAVPLAMLPLTPWPGWAGWRGTGSRRAWRRATLAAAGPIAGASAHLAYLWWRFGDPFVFVSAQQGWRHSDSLFPFVTTRVRAVSELGLSGFVHEGPGVALGTLVPVLVVALIWRVWRLSPAYATLVAAMFLPALAIDLPSIGRIASPLFPLFIALASLLPNRRTAWLVGGLFGALQMWAAWVFFSWGQLY